MPIKQIQLRGISRTPSDRMSADGGLAESLNVHIDEQETAPTLPPEDVTTQFGSNVDSYLDGPALYIHKGQNYENLIYLSGGYIKAIPKTDGAITSPMNVYRLQTDEEVLSITSIGNTLVICTNQRIEYVLHKEDGYQDLGDKIPVPNIEFKSSVAYSSGVTEGTSDGYFPLSAGSSIRLVDDFNPKSNNPDTGLSDTYYETCNYDVLKALELFAWRDYLAGKSEYEAYQIYPSSRREYIKTVDMTEQFNEVNRLIWDNVKKQITRAKKAYGYFAAPVFVRYALKLYDGSYIYQSVPILLGGGLGDLFSATAYKKKHLRELDGDTPIYAYNTEIKVILSGGYKAKAFLKDIDYSSWTDIVTSIDVFLSTDIHNPSLNKDLESFDLIAGGTDESSFSLSFADSDRQLVDDRIRDEILSKSLFYKIASFDINKLDRLTAGYDLLQNSDFASQDYLVTQDTLPDDFMSFHKKMAKDIFVYNHRAMLKNITQEVYSGYPFLNGASAVIDIAEPYRTEKYVYDFGFYLHDSGNNGLRVASRNISGGYTIEPYTIEVSTSGSSPTTYENFARAYSWLAYPDTRCYKVVVKTKKINVVDGVETIEYIERRTYPMEAHPLLNCSYVFIGLGRTKQFGLSGTDAYERLYTQDGKSLPVMERKDSIVPGRWSYIENKTYIENNIVWASLPDNPFSFPASGRLTFSNDIIALAVATKALSEGQFGQFPLYVFTSGGIWSVPITDAGDFAAIVPLSMDVAVSPKTVLGIRQAVVFVSNRGVMLLQGSDITNLSPNMNGRHYVLDEDVIQRLSETAWGTLAALEDDPDPFMNFVKNASIAYDTAGARIIFFNENKNYQYAYYFGTQTWHKLYTPMRNPRVLNSYPECLVSAAAMASMRQMVLDFTTVLDDADVLSDTENSVKGIIITRPFDLGEPDIRKAIKEVRIRGRYNRGNVRYILLGSFDGIHWQRLHSLRGGSYKMFRMVILTDLAPTERISWIDIDYESRFTNRLR